MGKLTKNSDGTYTMQGFSNKNPEDMKAVVAIAIKEVKKKSKK